MTAETETTPVVPTATKPVEVKTEVKAEAAPASAPKKTSSKPAPSKAKPVKKAAVKRQSKPAAARKKTATRKPTASKTAPKAAKPATAKPTAASKPQDIAQDISKEVQTMFESSLKQMQDVMSEFKGGYADLPLANEELSQVVEASRDATVTGMNELNKELSEFTQTRMTECWETTREVLGAKSLPEAFEVQSKYMQDVYKAYADEAQKLNTIATELTQKMFAPMTNGLTDVFGKMFTGKSS